MQQESVNEIAQIFDCKSDNFQKLKRNGNVREVLQSIISQTQNFIKLNFPSTPYQDLIAAEFAEDIFETSPDWKKEDVILLFKHIKRNQHDENYHVMGNIITPIKLMELVSHYEEAKAQEREKRYSQFKKREFEDTPKLEPTGEYVGAEKYGELAAKIADQFKPKYDLKSPGIIENAFDPIQKPEHFEQFKKLIQGLSDDDKNKFHTDIFNYHSIVKEEMERRETLLKLLNN